MHVMTHYNKIQLIILFIESPSQNDFLHLAERGLILDGPTEMCFLLKCYFLEIVYWRIFRIDYGMHTSSTLSLLHKERE